MIVRDTILVQQRFDKYLVVGFVNTANQLEQQGPKDRYQAFSKSQARIDYQKENGYN
ncbi:MAG: hypothetical protein IPL08_11585 [Saprospiraceae bacterium]|nr:hypothetical protein [Saprospiraceae bacterium]